MMRCVLIAFHSSLKTDVCSSRSTGSPVRLCHRILGFGGDGRVGRGFPLCCGRGVSLKEPPSQHGVDGAPGPCPRSVPSAPTRTPAMSTGGGPWALSLLSPSTPWTSPRHVGDKLSRPLWSQFQGRERLRGLGRTGVQRQRCFHPPEITSAGDCAVSLFLLWGPRLRPRGCAGQMRSEAAIVCMYAFIYF